MERQNNGASEKWAVLPCSEPPDDGSTLSLLSQLQMVELLVAHGSSLDTKSVLEETPLGEPSTQIRHGHFSMLG